ERRPNPQSQLDHSRVRSAFERVRCQLDVECAVGGLVNANNSSGNILNISGLVVNNASGGFLEASGGGVLNLSGSSITNSGQITAVGAGSLVIINATDITGGTLNTLAGGEIRIQTPFGQAATAIFGGNINVFGTVNVVNGSSMFLNPGTD